MIMARLLTSERNVLVNEAAVQPQYHHDQRPRTCAKVIVNLFCFCFFLSNKNTVKLLPFLKKELAPKSSADEPR